MKNKKGFGFIFLGLLLIAAALSLAVYNLYDAHRATQSVRQIIDQMDTILVSTEPVQTEQSTQAPIDTTEAAVPDYVWNPDMEMPTVRIDGRDYIGVLRIPSWDLELPVISRWSYPDLKIAPCRYGGSAYTNDLIIAAHNYDSHFGNLKTLTVGDTVLFTDMDGNVFTYTVVERETLMATAVGEMTGGEWDLTLFTCTVGGTYRVTVRCDLVSEAPAQ